MAALLEYKRRVRLPDALPEQSVPRPPAGRARTVILTGSLGAYAAVVVLGATLAPGALRFGNTSAADGPPSRSPGTRAGFAVAPAAEDHSLPEPRGPAATATNMATASRDNVGSSAPDPEETPSSAEALPTCEDALARHSYASSSASLPRNMTGSAYGALLDGKTAQDLLRDCTPDAWVRADLCVAVSGVRAVGATVRTAPSNAAVERCMAGAVARLTFSYQRDLQLFRTTVTVTPNRRKGR